MATPGEEFAGDSPSAAGSQKAAESFRHPENQRTLRGPSVQTSANVE